MPPRSPELPSARVTEDLRRRLESGEWDSGEALPSVGKLADHYSASRTTIGKALKVLESDGMVTIVPRWGTFRA
jgi:GntR family transcriptional regulator